MIHRRVASECINACDPDSSLLPSKKQVRIGCFHRLTEGDASYCILQSNRLLEADPPHRSFVFRGSKEGLLMLCDRATIEDLPVPDGIRQDRIRRSLDILFPAPSARSAILKVRRRSVFAKNGAA